MNTVFRAGVGLYTTSMRDPTATGGPRPPATGGIHSAYWGSQLSGVPVGVCLKQDVNMMIMEDRPPRLGGGMVTFEDMRHIVVAYSEYHQAYAYHKPKTKLTGRSRGRKSSKARQSK